MKFRLYAFIHITLSLVLGGMIYIFLREKTFLHQLFAFSMESIFSRIHFFGDSFIRYYFPDFLWEYALCFSLYIFYPPTLKKFSAFPAIISFAIGYLYEVAQFLDILPGTGDPADVLLYLFAATAAYGIILIYINHSKKEKEK